MPNQSSCPLVRPAAFPYVGHTFQGWALPAAGHLRHPGEDVFRPYHPRQPAAGVCCHADAAPESNHSWRWVEQPFRRQPGCSASGNNRRLRHSLHHQVPASWTELWLSTTSCLPANFTTTSPLKNWELCWRSPLLRWLLSPSCGLCRQGFHHVKLEAWAVCSVSSNFTLSNQTTLTWNY